MVMFFSKRREYIITTIQWPTKTLILCHQILREQHGYTWHIVSITRGMEKFMWDPEFNAAILKLELYLKRNRLRSELYKENWESVHAGLPPMENIVSV